MSENRKVIVIGAGVAGLSAGCYLQMNGYTTEICEMGKAPGGVCTGWKRHDYTFDGCLQWLLGTAPSSEFHRLWQELHALDGRQIVTFDEVKQIETSRGTFFPVPADLDRLAAGLKTFSPADAGAIDDFIADAKRFASYQFPIGAGQMSLIEQAAALVKQAPMLLLLGKYRRFSIGQYVERFSDPIIKEILVAIIGDERVSVAALLMMLAWFHRKEAGYPLGGSLALAKSLEQRYLGLGGKIYYGARVATVTVKDNTATGVELMKGGTYPADIVVSAADGNSSIFRMLGGDYVNRQIVDDYNDMELFPAMIQVSLGVAKRCTGPHHLTLALDRPFSVDDKTNTDRIDVMVYHFDRSLAPEGKTSITALFPASYEYWLNLRNNHARKYLMEKERIATEIIGILDKRLDGIAAKVEVYDVATPATYIRYTNCWRGSYEGWLPTPYALGKTLPKTLPGLRNFYMAGQWVEPGGGLPAVALSGRNVARLICKKDGRKFKTFL